MYKSCKECKSPCCQTGEGPFKNLSPEDYLDSFGTLDAYNTKCIALSEKGTCNLWGTSDLPQECRTYICQSKIFTKEELLIIESITDERSCSNCGCGWIKGFTKSNKIFLDVCEICGSTIKWDKSILVRGKRKKRSISKIKKEKGLSSECL